MGCNWLPKTVWASNIAERRLCPVVPSILTELEWAIAHLAHLPVTPLSFILAVLGGVSCVPVFRGCEHDSKCHSSLLSTFGLNATSPYNSYLPIIYGKFALI